MVELDPTNSSEVKLYAYDANTGPTTSSSPTASAASGTGSFQLLNPRQVYLATSFANAAAVNPVTISLSDPAAAGAINSLVPSDVAGGMTILFDPGTAVDTSTGAINAGSGNGLYTGEAVMYLIAPPPSVSVTANGIDTSFAQSTSGSGGVVAGQAASADVVVLANTNAYVQNGGNLSVASLSVNATHTENFDSETNTVPGFHTRDERLLDENEVTSYVDATIGDNTTITADSLKLTANDIEYKKLVNRTR